VANTVTITVDADTKAAENNVKGMGSKMQGAMKGVAKAAGGLTVAAGAATMLGQEYQEATNTIAAGTGATGKQLEGLKESFKGVWADVPQDAGKVAAAIADVNTEMGLEGEALENVTKAFLDVSRAMGEDASPMIKGVADAMIAMGEPVENTKAFLDELTVASQAVGVPMTTLADKVIKFGPQLNALGLPLTEATALIANMEAKGIDVGKMMPGLNTAIKKLADEGVTDITGGLNAAINSIKNAGTDAEGLGIAMDLFGAGAGLRFKEAIDKGGLSTDDLIKAMEGAGGTVTALAAETLTTADKFDIMKNKIKANLAPLGDFANKMGPMLMMVPALATGVSALAGSQVFQTAITWLQTAAMTALNFAMGPIGLIILGIVAAVAAAILIFKNWDKIVEVLKTTWDKVWNGMKDTVKAVVNPIIGFINAIIRGINGMIDGINKIEIKIPDWVPLIGGNSFKFDIPKLPEIPAMAEGGIVRSPTLAMIGERGPEAVIPLGRGGGSGGTGTTINIQILGPTYGFDDFEDKIGEAITDGIRRGGFSGTLAAA
tara:strand:- start:972 stop:2612 length:1641 start_codon:yes stop_codon:yes gene_type:complete